MQSQETPRLQHAEVERKLFSLQRLSGTPLPLTHLTGNEFRRQSAQPRYSSQMFDIFEGIYLGMVKVALKSLRVNQQQEVGLHVSRI